MSRPSAARRLWAGLAAGIAVAAATPSLAQTAAAPPKEADAAPWGAMSADELARVRGGYLSAGGLVFDFGAVVRTYVDGGLVMETTLNWTPQGAQALSGSVAPSVTDLAGGGTTVLHALGPSQLANVVLNTASNRDIRQDTDITLTLPGFASTQRDLQLHGLNAAFLDQMAATFRIGGR